MSETNAKSSSARWCSEDGYRLLNLTKRLIREAEATNIKEIVLEITHDEELYQSLVNRLLKDSWNPSCQTLKYKHQQLWNENLQFIREKDWLKKESKVLILKREYHASIAERNRALDETTTIDIGRLSYLLNEQKEKGKLYDEELKRIKKQVKSIYPIYDVILACREKMIFGLSNSNLSIDDAKRYCELGVIANALVQDRPPYFDQQETIDGTPMATKYQLTHSLLNHVWWRHKCILLILQTVLTLKCLSDEERHTFMEHSNYVEKLIDICEACYVYTLVQAYLNGNDVTSQHEMVNNFREKCEHLLIKNDAFLTKQFLVAITVLHFDRECQNPILKFCIDVYRRSSESNIETIDKAITILHQQKNKMCAADEPSPFESIGLIPKSRQYYQRLKIHWYGQSNYLCISNSSKFDFPVYIHRSEIIRLIKLIREQFAFDLDGQYEEEVALELPHEPLSSLVVYLLKDLQNAKHIQGQLHSGQQLIEINEKNCYVRLPNVPVTYQKLKQNIFDRLLNRSEQYVRWFRQIMNESGKNIDSDDHFVLFAHAKVVSECVRNLSTWMINLMCLDLIEAGIILDEKYYINNSDKIPKNLEIYSPWNLFFDYHPMAGGSYHDRKFIDEGNWNQHEIENKEVRIVMNWLCNSWAGSEQVTLVNNIDINSLEKINRNELEDAEKYGRSRIINMLYYRTYLTVRWGYNHHKEVPFNRFVSSFDDKPRRILGQMLFDKQPLRISDTTVDSNDSPQELKLKQKQRDSSIKNDRYQVAEKSIERFTKLVEKTKSGRSLQAFYKCKLRQLESDNYLIDKRK